MQLHNLKKNRNNRAAKQVGRGGKRGKTSGKGTKGQNARSGRKKRPEMRDVIKRLPKLRGRGKNFLKSIVGKPTVLSLNILDKNFKAGETVSPASLLAKGLIKKEKGSLPKVKILGGKLTKKLVFENISMSHSANSTLAA